MIQYRQNLVYSPLFLPHLHSPLKSLAALLLRPLTRLTSSKTWVEQQQNQRPLRGLRFQDQPSEILSVLLRQRLNLFSALNQIKEDFSVANRRPRRQRTLTQSPPETSSELKLLRIEFFRKPSSKAEPLFHYLANLVRTKMNLSKTVFISPTFHRCHKNIYPFHNNCRTSLADAPLRNQIKFFQGTTSSAKIDTSVPPPPVFKPIQTRLGKRPLGGAPEPQDKTAAQDALAKRRISPLPNYFDESPVVGEKIFFPLRPFK